MRLFRVKYHPPVSLRILVNRQRFWNESDGLESRDWKSDRMRTCSKDKKVTQGDTVKSWAACWSGDP
jgi:hypothetical protein